MLAAALSAVPIGIVVLSIAMNAAFTSTPSLKPTHAEGPWGGIISFFIVFLVLGLVFTSGFAASRLTRRAIRKRYQDVR